MHKTVYVIKEEQYNTQVQCYHRSPPPPRTTIKIRSINKMVSPEQNSSIKITKYFIFLIVTYGG